MNKEMLPSEKEALETGYSQAVVFNNDIYISGQVAMNSEGKVVGMNDFEKQARFVFDSIEKIMSSKNSSMNDIVWLTIFITDMGNLKKFREIRSEYFEEWVPASTLVEVNSLIDENLLLEIAAIGKI